MMQASLDLATRDGIEISPIDVSTSPLAVRGLTVSYGDKPAVFSVDATFPAEAVSAIIGPNGAGKSTMLKAVLGIVPRLSGETRTYLSLVPVRKRKDRGSLLSWCRAAASW